MTTTSPDIVVVGSVNQDVSVPVERFASPGETVLGGDALWTGGGKGANQAVAAARLGRSVAMIADVGRDVVGRDLVAALAADNVDVAAVGFRADAPTGVALISVASLGAEPSGENCIVVSPGANARLGVEGRVADAVAELGPRAVLIQLEVPDRAVADAVASGREIGAVVVLNPAPARPLPADVVAGVDVLVPNRSELALLSGGTETSDVDELVAQARHLGVARVVVTLGADGALVIDGMPEDGGRVELVPVVEADVVDTTAAGDSFCGALVDGLLDGLELAAAARWATRAAAVTVSRRGAQVSLPTRSDLA